MIIPNSSAEFACVTIRIERRDIPRSVAHPIPRGDSQRHSTEFRAPPSARGLSATFRGVSRSPFSAAVRPDIVHYVCVLDQDSSRSILVPIPSAPALCPPCGNQVHAASMDRLFSPRGALRPLRFARALDLRSARLPSESSLRSSSTAHHRSPFSLRTIQPPFSGTANTVRIDSVDFTWSVVRLIRCSDDSSL